MERKRLGKGKLPSITPTDMPLYILYVKKDSKDFIYFYNKKDSHFKREENLVFKKSERKMS